ncbi:unnamed protein product [Phytophthora lilii]|uniref:Unnamed protein product n=1 Tax=Phytophthora lilii TaxID=2077276 RepID=A0A9W6WMK5_9STRA|nr:unnamed protein product [Phytophthora lilii]
MPKTEGSRNYNLDEQRLLLATIAERLPLRKADWSDVASAYNTTKKQARKDRTAASLKRKFTGLYAAAKHHSPYDAAHGGQRDVEQVALQLKHKIAYHTRRPQDAGANRVPDVLLSTRQPQDVLEITADLNMPCLVPRLWKWRRHHKPTARLPQRAQ